MRRILLAALIVLTPLAAAAQEEDRSRLVALLEGALSDDAARQVRIEGFQGALSSVASLDRMTIADELGVWLTLEDVTLDWNRSALFSRALEVNSLTAGRLELARLPRTDGLPDAEAQPFSLPELPLSIRIAETAIDRVEIGEPVFGQAVVFSVDGAAELADGEGQASIALNRLDGPAGEFSLTASFDNETRQLELDMDFLEEAGGLAATLLGIPGAPSVTLSVAGEGPLSAFDAAFELATDGTPRLAGDFRIEEPQPGARRVALDVAGDVTAIVLPEYRDFFGPDVALTALLTQNPDGSLALDPFRLEAAALQLEGQLALDPQSRPDSFSITGNISPVTTGADRVRLPIAGAEVWVGDTDLTVAFSRSEGNAWRGSAEIARLEADDLRAELITLTMGGQITEGAQGLDGVTARISALAGGLSHSDPALERAIGNTADLQVAIDWERDAPLALSGLRLAAGGVTLDGEVTAELGENRLDVIYDFALGAPDLARFGPAVGQDLQGAANLTITGEAEALSGAFDLALNGTTQNLRVAEGVPPALLGGQTTIAANVARDETGLVIEGLSIDGQEITASGSARLSSTSSAVSVNGRLRDAGLFTNALSGAIDLDASLTRGADPFWTLDSTLNGPGGMVLELAGAVGQPGGTVDLGLTGQVPLALADPFIAPRSVRGDLALNLRVAGAPAIGNLSGQVSTSGTRLAAPTLALSLNDISATATIAAGSAQVTAGATIDSGGQVTATGTVGFANPRLPADIQISLASIRLVDPLLYEATIPEGRLSFIGDLAGDARLSGDILIGETEVRVPETSLGATEPVPLITHIGETAAQRRTRGFAGLLIDPSERRGGGGERGGNIALDLTVNAPGRIFLRGRGLDAELGGVLRIGGTTSSVIPDGRFELVRGRLAILGQRLDLTEGSATLTGDFNPFIRLVAQSRAGEYVVRIILQGQVSAPTVLFESDPDLPQDEILSQFFFGRSVSNLSAIQAIQLADAVAGLAGGNSSGGVFNRLRENLGLDDLDVQTNEDGSAGLRAGRYISDNVYTDVTVGSEGGADISLNIDITPDVTARGSFGSDGDSSLGVFFERDY